MDTRASYPSQTPAEAVAPEGGFPTPEHVRTCGHCQYDGPLQVRYIYPLLLRWPIIAAGFVLGILPGLFLLNWRRNTLPTRAMTCPLCLFLRLETAAAPN